MKNIVFFIMIFILCGCGYTTRGFSYEYDKIIVKPIVNKINITAENRSDTGYANFPILIENKLTNELINQFNIDGSIQVVNQAPQAMALNCAIEEYSKETLRYTNSDDIKEQKLRLRVNMKLTSPDGNVLKQATVTGETSYYLSGTNQKSEASAQIDLIEDTARRISEAVIEEW